jgi:hypothetical protein
MSVLLPLNALRNGRFGQKIEQAAKTLPQTAAGALFTVTGGRVAITQIIGEVTTAIQNQANNTKLVSAPTVGTTTDLCAVLNIAADEVGCLYGMSGLNSDALIGLNAGSLPAQVRDVVVAAGSINLDCAASNTGAIKWTLFYIPIDDGASVAAA